MIIKIILTTIILYYNKAFTNEFRCLIASSPWKKNTIQLDFTFNCKKFRITDSGCLKNMSIAFLASTLGKFRYISDRRFIHNSKQIVYKFSEMDLFTLKPKSRTLKNVESLNKKNKTSTSIAIAIPIPNQISYKLNDLGENLVMKSLILGTFIPTNSLSSYIILKYEITKLGISEIFYEGNPHGLFHCEQLINGELKRNIDNEKNGENFKVPSVKAIIFDRFMEFTNNLKVEVLDKKQKVIILGNSFQNESEKVFEKAVRQKGNTIGVISSVDCDFTLLISHGFMFGLSNAENRMKEEIYKLPASKDLAALYKLKRLDRKGTTLLNK